MTATYFGLYLVAVVGLLAGIAWKYLTAGRALAVLGGLAVWLAYVGGLSYAGVVSNLEMRPPGVFLIVVPVFVFVAVVLGRGAVGGRVAETLPLWLPLAFQAFRVGVELLLHALYTDGLVPRLMTYEGGNVDIFVGLTAPLAAWAATKGAGGRRLALVWNVAGVLALVNIIGRAALTVPGPLNKIASEVPNLAMGQFPYTFIAGFFAPLAMATHVVSIRSLNRSLNGALKNK